MNDPKRILIVLLGLILVVLGAFGIKHYADGEGYKNQVNYTTAVQATDADHFNYIVDSQQGRVLATGNFTIDKKDAVKFDEMNKSYGYVRRVKEHYTMHTREVCSTDSEGHQYCRIEVYYTWDYAGEDSKESPIVTLFDRQYPTTLFGVGVFISDTDCSDFMSAGSGTGWFQTKHGCISGDNYLDDDDRYTYWTMPLNFSGTFLATTHGGLKPFNESSISLQQKSISQTLHDVGNYKIIGFWVLLITLILFTCFAGFIAYSWVIEDGIWSLDR